MIARARDCAGRACDRRRWSSSSITTIRSPTTWSSTSASWAHRWSCVATTRRPSSNCAALAPARDRDFTRSRPIRSRPACRSTSSGNSARACRCWVCAWDIRPSGSRLAVTSFARRCRFTARPPPSSTTARASSPASPRPFRRRRYHSLVVAEQTLAPDLEVTARTKEDGLVMGLRHRTLADSRRAISPRVDPHATKAGESFAISSRCDHVSSADRKTSPPGRPDDDEAADAMAAIMRGEATPAQIAGLLIGLAHERRASGRAGGLRANDARECGADRREARRGVRHVRHRRRSIGHLQHFHGVGDRAGGVRTCAWPSTAIDRCRANAAAPTCSRRSASTIQATAASVAVLSGRSRLGVSVRTDISSGDEACGAGTQGSWRADGVQPARPADQSCRRRSTDRRRAPARS